MVFCSAIPDLIRKTQLVSARPDLKTGRLIIIFLPPQHFIIKRIGNHPRSSEKILLLDSCAPHPRPDHLFSLYDISAWPDHIKNNCYAKKSDNIPACGIKISFLCREKSLNPDESADKACYRTPFWNPGKIAVGIFRQKSFLIPSDLGLTFLCFFLTALSLHLLSLLPCFRSYMLCCMCLPSLCSAYSALQYIISNFFAQISAQSLKNKNEIAIIN